MLIRCAFLSLGLLAGAVLAAPPVPSKPVDQTPPPAAGSGSRVELPGGTQRIRAGAGAATPTSGAPAPAASAAQQQFNRSHHVRRQEALQHAQGVITSKEQLRSGAKPTTAP